MLLSHTHTRTHALTHTHAHMHTHMPWRQKEPYTYMRVVSYLAPLNTERNQKRQRKFSGDNITCHIGRPVFLLLTAVILRGLYPKECAIITRVTSSQTPYIPHSFLSVDRPFCNLLVDYVALIVCLGRCKQDDLCNKLEM